MVLIFVNCHILCSKSFSPLIFFTPSLSYPSSSLLLSSLTMVFFSARVFFPSQSFSITVFSHLLISSTTLFFQISSSVLQSLSASLSFLPYRLDLLIIFPSQSSSILIYFHSSFHISIFSRPVVLPQSFSLNRSTSVFSLRRPVSPYRLSITSAFPSSVFSHLLFFSHLSLFAPQSFCTSVFLHLSLFAPQSFCTSVSSHLILFPPHRRHHLCVSFIFEILLLSIFPFSSSLVSYP
jgi:hypothetical protein